MAEPMPDQLDAVLTAYREIRGVGEAADGRVRIVVDGSSDIVELTLDPFAMRLASDDLRSAFLEAFRAARAEAQRQAAEVSPLRLSLPADTQAMLTEASSLAERSLDGLDRLAESFSRRAARGTP